jgi:hypothetical protein
MLTLVACLLAGAVVAQGYIPSGSTSSGRTTPAQIVSAVQDAGVLPAANVDLYATTFVSTGFSADGGTGGYSYMCNGPRCVYKTAEGSSADVIAENNGLDFSTLAQVKLPTTYVPAIANPSGNSLYFFSDSGQWIYDFPSSDTSGCAANREGGHKARSTDHRWVYCDGTTVQQLAFSLQGSASLDFPSLAANEKSSALTVTVGGAATTDRAIHCQAEGSLGNNLRVFEAWVSSANTVSVRLENTDDADSEDLAATTFYCTITR